MGKDMIGPESNPLRRLARWANGGLIEPSNSSDISPSQDPRTVEPVSGLTTIRKFLAHHRTGRARALVGIAAFGATLGALVTGERTVIAAPLPEATKAAGSDAAREAAGTAPVTARQVDAHADGPVPDAPTAEPATSAGGPVIAPEDVSAAPESALPAVIIDKPVEQTVMEAPGEDVLPIVFGPTYDGQNPDREADARRLLSSIWRAAKVKSNTLATAADFFIKYTASGTSPQKIDDLREGAKLYGDVSLEVRAPEGGFIKVHPESPVGLRVALFSGTNTTPKGETQPITKVTMVLLVGETNHPFDPRSIEEYAQYLLLPRHLAAYTNLALRQLMVREGVTTYDGVKARVGDTGSEFYDNVTVRALDKTYSDTRRIFEETPSDAWDKKNTIFRRDFEAWLMIAERPGATEEERHQFIRQPSLRNNP